MATPNADRNETEALLTKMDSNEMENLFWGLWNNNKHDYDFVNEVLDLINQDDE